MSLTLKAITVGSVVHTFQWVFKNIVLTCEKSCVYWTNSKITTLHSAFAKTCTHHQDFLTDPYCYKTLSNRFYESINRTKLLASTHSKTSISWFHATMDYLVHYYCLMAKDQWKI